MASQDDAALFARLRALRSSAENVGSTTPDRSSTTDTNPRAATLEERFRKLRSLNSEHDQKISSASEEDQFTVGLDKTTESEDILQTAAALDAEKDVGMSDFPEVGGLLGEAKSLTDQYQASSLADEGPSQGGEESQAAATHQRSKSEDSELASEYIQQVLDELKASGLHGEDGTEEKEGKDDKEEPEGGFGVAADKSPTEDKMGEDEEADSSVLDLPSVPSGPSTQAASGKDTDDELFARLAALKVTSTPGGIASPSARSEAELRWASIDKDDDDTTWCVICCDDATIKCLGCDGDLYCGGCWKEGHRSEDAGMEERMHKAVLYQKPGKKKRIIAA
jgi:hypothetical protein